MKNTIVAISTPMGNGGIGIIRISGDDTFSIINKIFIPKNKNSKIEGFKIKYGNIINPKNNELIDEVLVSYFKNPKSYTREDLCEINTHGGIIIQKKILELCLNNGAELAGPGEFTKRAFLNGRIDLSQAESIIDLINAKTDKEAEESINQLEGKLSKKINEINQKILDIMVKIEVNIDYPEYDVEELSNNEAIINLEKIDELLINLENSFSKGKILKNGINTVIIGKPNVGKSSLLNSMLNEDRAIVSNIEGTTRDTIEEQVNVQGILLNLIDTAGIRSSNDEIEKIGIYKSKKLAKDADLIIAIFDLSKDLTEEDEEIIDIIKDKETIILLNKVDINKKNSKLENKISTLCKPIIKTSIIEDERQEELYNKINEIFNSGNIENDNTIIITNERHKNQIKKAREDIENAMKTIAENLPIDISSIYIKQALNDLGEITGKNVSEDIINEIFKKFCLGK